MAEVIVALDLPTADQALRLVERIPELRWAKIGAQLFATAGSKLVGELKDRGILVFLDLKWHDIPHQVTGAAAAAAALDVDLATVHALGGEVMMAAAREAAGDMRVVAVTLLTSHSPADVDAILGRNGVSVPDEVARLAGLAQAAGLAGVVCSPQEVARLRGALGPEAWLVVPGIRRAGAGHEDQRRVGEPAATVAAGATHLVVGRPITRADEPQTVYEAICEAIG